MLLIVYLFQRQGSKIGKYKMGAGIKKLTL